MIANIFISKTSVPKQSPLTHRNPKTRRNIHEDAPQLGPAAARLAARHSALCAGQWLVWHSASQ